MILSSLECLSQRPNVRMRIIKYIGVYNAKVGNIKMTLKEIQDIIISENYHFSEHAVKRMILRFIDRHEIEESILDGEIIEEYPDDKYSPSCLVYGKTQKGRDLHIQISFPPYVVIITAYEPNPEEWVNYRLRRAPR